MPLWVGRAGSPSNTMSLNGPRPTSVPSGIQIHETVWQQYTRVTDDRRQTTDDRQTTSHDNNRTLHCNGRLKKLIVVRCMHSHSQWSPSVCMHVRLCIGFFSFEKTPLRIIVGRPIHCGRKAAVTRLCCRLSITCHGSCHTPTFCLSNPASSDFILADIS